MTDTKRTGCNSLRARHALLGHDSDLVDVDFEGRKIKARRGESLLAALVASGELRLRIDKDGGFRGPFCGMGVCQECLVDVDGASAERACMTKVDRAMTVRRQASRVAIDGKVADGSADQASCELSALTPQIAVIGGGPGGMAAAASAARSGADVLLIDERPQPGGQFYKQPLAAGDLRLADFDDRQFLGGRRLIGELEGSGARLMHSAKVVGAYEPLDLVVSVENETRLVRPQILIVATGAYEISYPFDGWTLPGVMTTGAAQTLLRSYRVLPGQRVLVAGNGPLNFQVAAELARSGADVVAVVEAAARPGLYDLNTIARMMTADARLALKGAGYLSTLGRRGVPLLFGHKISRVSALDGGNRRRLLAVIDGLSDDNSQAHEFEADAVCLGYGFRPSNDILRALGCEHTVNPHTGALETVRDKDCRTSRNNVLAVGDCTRLGGAPAAQAEGVIAAGAALDVLGIAQSPSQQKTVGQRHADLLRHGRFQNTLWTLFRSAGPLFSRIDEQALICRCEELTLADIQSVVDDQGSFSMASLKRATRAGMGRCQGRYCGATLERLVAAQRGTAIEEVDLWAPRPPTSPTRIADLAKLSLPDDGPDP